MKGADRKVTRVKAGNVTLPIYATRDGRFMLVYREGGKRVRRPYTSMAKAKAVAEERAIAQNNGKLAMLDFTALDREIYMTARQRLLPFGIPLNTVVEEWLAGRGRNEIAPAGSQLVPEIVEQFLSAKADETSHSYMRKLRGDLRRFATEFGGAIRDITPDAIRKYLRALQVGPRRRNNIRDAIASLFIHAKHNGQLPRDRTSAAELVPRLGLADWVPTTYTPEELSLLLAHVGQAWLPWLAIGAFAGVRPEEMACEHTPNSGGEGRRLMWSDFKWARRMIEIPAIVSKTGRKRLVPISDQLMAWLEPWHGAHGAVCPTTRVGRNGRTVSDRYYDETARLAEASGVKWKRDALRHSFCSYWLSMHHDLGKLAEIAGNSAEIIRKHYQDAKYPEEAMAWFSIMPERAGNITQMPLPMTWAK